VNGILVDVSKCTGCEKCVSACVTAHHQDPILADRDRTAARDGLSANRLCTVIPASDHHFVRKSCMHCIEPSCVSACLVGGLTRTEEGAIVYDAEKCIGCRYCMLACPFHIPRYEWDKQIPFVQKCDMCFDRMKHGAIPACVDACKKGALTFGKRSKLLTIAHDRIKEAPRRYFHHVWGESEYGGTSVLYISDIDISEMGWPKTKTASIPSLTEPLIKMTPVIGISVGLGLWALSAIIARRNKLMALQATPVDAAQITAKSEKNDREN